MDIHLEDLDEKTRFDIKLQIELYNLATKVMNRRRKGEFEEYMEERIEKIRKILNKEHGKIYEGKTLIFSF